MGAPVSARYGRAGFVVIRSPHRANALMVYVFGFGFPKEKTPQGVDRAGQLAASCSRQKESF